MSLGRLLLTILRMPTSSIGCGNYSHAQCTGNSMDVKSCVNKCQENFLLMGKIVQFWYCNIKFYSQRSHRLRSMLLGIWDRGIFYRCDRNLHRPRSDFTSSRQNPPISYNSSCMGISIHLLHVRNYLYLPLPTPTTC